jgi:hypothetical protein
MASLPKARVVVGPNNAVTVHVSGETLYSIEATSQLQRSILGRLGCTTCCSGYNFLFQQEEQQFSIS